MLKSVMFVLTFLLMATTTYAEVMTFEKETEEIVANDQSREQVEAFALQKVKRLAVEEAGTYISSLTVVSNMQLQKDELTALASGVVQAKIIGTPVLRMENGVIHVNVKARIQVDTAILEKEVAALLKKQGELKRLEEVQNKVNELESKLTNLKISELKRLEDLNNQAIALEQERERRRLANAEIALQAQGELKKVEIERLQKEREIQQQTAKMLAEQEQQRKAEADTLLKEQNRIRRAQLENEQRWNDLARKSQLAQKQWVTIDDSLSLKQALEEAKSIKQEIANLKQRSKFQYEESVRTLKAAYQQQIAATTAKMPQPLAERDPFESTSEYTARKTAFDKDVETAKDENTKNIKKLKGEETLKLAQAKLEYLKQQLKVLDPFIKRLQALQARLFVLPGELVTVELGTPDADRNCFPTTITHKKERWNVDWKYSDRDKARDIYSTRNFLKAEALVQLSETNQKKYAITEIRITHPGTGLQQNLEVARPIEIAEIAAFEILSNDFSEAEKETKLAENNLRTCIERDDKDKDGFRFCGDVVLDVSTGLMWARHVSNKTFTWIDATTHSNSLTIGVYKDWRLPTIEELNAIGEKDSNGIRYLKYIGFYIESGFQSYWSSTDFTGQGFLGSCKLAGECAHYISFSSSKEKPHIGYYSKNYVNAKYRLWAVRSN